MDSRSDVNEYTMVSCSSRIVWMRNRCQLSRLIRVSVCGIITFLSLAFAFTPALGNVTDASVVVSFSPPYTIPLNELTSARLKVIITAINGVIDRGKISVTIQGNNGIVLQNNPSTSVFELFMADVNVYQLTDADMQDIFDPANFTSNGITVAEAFDEGLPPGSYDICFRVYAPGRTALTPISPAPPLGCSAFVIQETSTAVTVSTLVQPPPFSPDLRDYPDKVNATLQSQGTRRVRLHLTITGDNGIIIRSRTGVITSQTIALEAGIPYMASGADLDPYFRTENLLFTGISAHAITNHGLPEGNYRFCLRAVDTRGNFVSAGDPLGCSNLVNIRLLEPPQLISPVCGNVFAVNAGQNIVFTWTVPPGSPPGIAYTLRVVEMVDAAKDANDAMFTATTPAFFEQTVVGATTFLYGPAQPVLEPGRKYAWQVIAGTGSGPDMTDAIRLFRNKGRSVVCSFTWSGPLNIIVPATGGKPKVAPPNAATNSEAVPIAVVKGKLHYKFKETMKTGTAQKYSGAIQSPNAVMGEKDLLYNKDVIDISGGQPLANTKISLVLLYVLDGKIDNKVYSSDPLKITDLTFGGNDIMQKVKGHETVLAATTTASDGSFVFQFVHTGDAFGKVHHNANWSFGGGDFTNTLKGTLYKVLRLKVEDKYYCSPDINIKVQPWEALDLGTLVSYVKSYDLKVVVQSTTASYYEKLQGGSGDPLAKASAVVTRKAKVIGVPQDEGEKSTDAKKLAPGSANVIAGAETDKNGQALFRKLVRHDPGNEQDRYYITCSTSKTEGNYNYKTKETRFAPFSMTEKKQFPFNTTAKETIKPKDGISYDEYYGSGIVWNSEFAIETFTKIIELKPELPRIAGKVYNKLAIDQPLPGEKVVLFSTYKASSDQNKPFRVAITDSKGRFEFKNLDIEIINAWDSTQKKFLNQLKGPERIIMCHVKGYKLYHNSLGILNHGVQIADANIPLEPNGWIAGKVVDESGSPVKASVYVEGTKKDTQFVFQYNAGAGGKSGKGGTVYVLPTTGMEYFEMKVPSGKGKKVVIVPADKAYEQEEYIEDIGGKPSSPSGSVKEYKVYRAMKRITFRILAGKATTGKLQLPSTSQGLAGVVVTLDLPAQKMSVTSDADGVVSFSFDNNSNGPFDFLVEPPDNLDFESTTYTLANAVNTKEPVQHPACYLKPATSISGVVILKGSNEPVKGATVYIDLGSGNTLETNTNEQGEYVLRKVPKTPQERTVVAGKPGTVPNLISQSKTISLSGSQNVLNFELEEDKVMVIQDIFGFAVAVEEMKDEPDGSRTIVKGRLIDIPGNANFKLYDQGVSLPFANLKMVKSKATGASGIPIGVPETNTVALDLQQLKLLVHDVFGAGLRADEDQLAVRSAEGAGQLSGTVSIQQSSFAWSDQYFSVGDGKEMFLASAVPVKEKEVVTITTGSYPKQKFFITDNGGNDFQFKYLGFKAKAARSHSFLEGEKIKLQTVLSTEKIPGMVPSQLDLNIGPLVLKTGSIETVTGTQPLSFKLEKWDVVCPKWMIHQHSAGILIPGGTVKTGMLDVPANAMTILPDKFEASGFDLQKITLSGVAPLTVANAGNVLFGYNSSIGKDQKAHWELRIFGEQGTPGATLSGLPGMEPGSTIDLDVVSLISNGEQQVSFSPQYKGTTFHKVLKTKPISFTGGDQYFQLYCTFDLGIPKVPSSNGILQFEKAGSGIALKMFPINVDVEGPGYVKFYSGVKQGDQQLKPGEFTSVGDIRDKEGIVLRGKLHRTVDKIWLDVDPKGQVMPLGKGNTSLADIEGKMEVDKNAAWTNFTFHGDMKGFKGMKGDLRKTFTVYGSIRADQESIDVKNIPTPFGGMELTYDIKNARLIGHMDIKKNIGALSLNGLANILVDGSGWYFLSGGAISTPGLGNISAGMLIGDYAMMPVDVSAKLMQFSYDKTVPSSFKTGISGFFFTGEKDLPVINVPDFSIDLGILSASMGAKAGLDGRLWMSFDDSGNSYGIGAMAFAHVYFKAASITCTKLGAEARAELGAKGIYTTGNGAFTVKGCGSITVTGSAKQCFPTPCLSDGVCCTGCIGDSISKGIKVDILLDSQGNTDLSFDFGNCSGQPTMSSNW